MWWVSGLDADDLLDATRADVRLGVEAELLFRAEPGDVLVEAVARVADVDPEALAGIDVDLGSLDDERRADLSRRPVGVTSDRDTPDRRARRAAGRACRRVERPTAGT